jgi:thioesterase domain-containing protein
MARQLENAGEQVESLALVSTHVENARLRWIFRLAAATAGIMHLPAERRVDVMLRVKQHVAPLQKFVRVSNGERLALLRQARRQSATPPGEQWESPQPIRLSTGNKEKIVEGRGRTPSHLYSRAYRSYLPGKYRGSLTLLPAEGDSIPGVNLYGWHRVADEITVRVLPGDHRSCVSTHRGVASEALAAVLASANGGGSRTV